MAFTVVVSTGHFVDYGDTDTYAVDENGVLWSSAISRAHDPVLWEQSCTNYRR